MTYLVLILLLVLLNGFFVASEFALVAIRRSQVLPLAESGNRAARRLLRVLDNLTGYISATQFGITIASLALGWIGEPFIATLIEHPLAGVVSERALAIIAFSLSFAVITFLHIVIGELAPKTLALEKALQVALFVAWPLAAFYRVFKWPISALDWAGTATVRLFGLKGTAEHHEVGSAEELRHVIDATEESGALNDEERALLSRVLDFSKTRVREILVPRTSMEAVAESAALAEVSAKFRTLGYSRLPVYQQNIDHIVGVVHRKDLEPYLDGSAGHDFSMAEVISPPQFLIPGITLRQAMNEMQAARSQLAFVVDEHGGVMGLITMEDLLEELVGEIYDEFDEPHEDAAIAHADGSVSLRGELTIRDVNRQLDCEIPEDRAYSTLSGFLANLLQHSGPPAAGSSIRFGDYTFQVTSVERRRIRRVVVRRA